MPQSPCACHSLHSNCDPKYCDEAALTGPGSSLSSHAGLFPELLLRNANKGCLTCEVLYLSIASRAVLIKEEDVMQEALTIERRSNCVLLHYDRHSWEYFQEAQSETQCKAFPLGSSSAISTNSDTSFIACKTWLDTCLKNHQLCRGNNPAILQKRVVDIGYLGSNSFSPYLYESNGEFSGYATLSHCWGQKQIITTKKATFEFRKKGIAWNELSKTFQDALVITEKLGLRYIWIDSLCIIQDDLLDWEIESKKMADIYKGSIVTIAAAKAREGEDGCFAIGRESKKIAPSRLHSNKPFEVWYKEWPEHFGFAFSGVRAGIPGLDLFGRAWTLQEELLAQRVLYYTEAEVVWQCKTLLDCTCGRIAQDLVQVGKQPLKLAYEATIRGSSQCDTMTYLWAKILTKYTSRKLTKQTDRFPALSGLAKIFQTRGLGYYVAGLWTKQLPLWLAWCLDHNVRPSSQYLFTAPSWSWGSITSGDEIAFRALDLLEMSPTANLQVKLEIKHVSCELASSDVTGVIKSGLLATTGPTVDGICGYYWTSDYKENFYCVKRDGAEVCIRHDRGDELMMSLAGQTVCCLLICVIECEGSEYAFFIVLATDDNSNNYRRIGLIGGEIVEELSEDPWGSWVNPEIKYKIPARWLGFAEQREFTIV